MYEMSAFLFAFFCVGKLKNVAHVQHISVRNVFR